MMIEGAQAMQDTLAVIRKTMQILDSPNYSHYSEGKAKTYPDYFVGRRADEDRLITPVLLPRFLEAILEFKLGQTISSKEPTQTGKPDFVPVDLRTHSFVFEAKGTDSLDLSQHYEEKRKYLEVHDVQHLVITNMRDLCVYALLSPQELGDYSFSFLQLYSDFKTDQKTILEKANTQRFLRFIQDFIFKELTSEEKLNRVLKAKPWRGDEELDVDLLTSKLRTVVELLYQDAKSRRGEVEDLSESDPDRAETIAKEIEWLSSEIDPTHKPHEVNADTLAEMLQAQGNELHARALEVFFYRVAYFTMTRILLARTWEDIGFIDQTLYDGGLDKFYHNSNREIQRVLKYAFQLAAERYEWLFNVENNYSWYEPSTEALIEALYELSNFNLRKLNQDILGTIYEEYIDRIDKKNKGQYYTPREIVGFIWDRVGFNNPRDLFDHEKGKRRPKLIFDPASGSGGFLVEAARRLREESQLDFNDKQDVLDLRSAIFAGLFGAEISPFPYYITEVNLLIQLTPVIQQLIRLQPALKREHLPLAVVLVDALSLHNDHRLIAEQSDEYKPDPLRSLLPLDRRKRVIFDKIKHELARGFAYCCANPPYIGEKGHKELFRSTRERYPYWQTYYQGKMDYLYWFIILGLSKLREGGRLGFITTAYWPTADGAAKLRKYILENAQIRELIFFEDVKIFEHAKGQHNMIFVLERCSNTKERDENRIKIVRVVCKDNELPGASIREKLRFLTAHILQHMNQEEYEDQYIKVFWSAVKQGELPKDGVPWHFEYGLDQDAMLNMIARKGTPLSAICYINSGVQSGADKVATRNIRLLTNEVISQHSIKIGDGIFVISEGELRQMRLTPKERSIVKSFFKNSHVYPYITGYLENEEKFFLIYSHNIALDDYPNIEKHLEKYRAILENKREFLTGQRKWYELQWPRNREIFEGTKIVNPQRALIDGPPYFAYSDETFYASVDVYCITLKKDTQESPLYLLGVLNSWMIKFWLSHKCKKKGSMLELYESPLANIPIRRIDFSNPQDVQKHNAIVEKVKTIREKLADLAQYSEYFDGPRLLRLKFDEPLPPINVEALLQGLPAKKLYSFRTHPEIAILKPKGLRDKDFYLQRIGKVQKTLEGPQLNLKSKAGEVVTLIAPESLLELARELLKSGKGKAWTKIKEDVLLPETIELFQQKKTRVLSKVERLRNEIQVLQKEIDDIILKLYDLTDVALVKGNARR